MPRRIAASFALTGLLILAAGDPTPARAQDPQAKFEPRSGPGAGQKFLTSFAGDWDVVKVFHPRQGDPVKVKGTCRQAMIHDGRFLQSDFTFEAAGGKTTSGQGLIGFEPETEAFTSVWTDSRQTKMSLRQSKDKFDGKSIVLFSKSLDSSGKDERRSKTISVLKDDGKTLHHRQFAIAADGQERLMMELIMTRK